jgi:CHASE3 domain sensor protein
LASLTEAGLAPLEGKPLADQIRSFIKDPLFAGNRERNMALNRVARELEQWTNSQGVLSARATDAIRKNAVNSIFANTPLTPKAKAKAVALTMSEIRPILIDAIEKAGGVGYRDYLQTYQAGMRNVNQKKLMGKALDLYKNNPDEFVKLVDGDAPDSVQKIMGYGNFNIVDELGEESMKVLDDAARTIKNAKEMTRQSSESQDALRDILEENVSLMRLPSLISAKFAVTNDAIRILEKKIGKKVIASLIEGLKTGKSARKLLDTLPTSEKNRVLSILSDPNNYGVPTGGLAVGSGAAESVQNFATDPVGSLLNRNQRNQLAPANQNQLAR